MILDTAFIFTVLSLTFRGFKRGFSQMLISFVVFVLSVIFAFSAYGKIGDSFVKSEKTSKLHTAISQTIEKQFETFENKSIETAPYLSSVTKFVFNSDSSDFGLDESANFIAENAFASTVTLPLIAFMYIAMRFIAFLIRLAVKKTTSLPVVHGVDCLLGAACGLVMSVLVIAVLFYLLSYVQFIPLFDFLKEQIDTSGIMLIINDLIF